MGSDCKYNQVVTAAGGPVADADIGVEIKIPEEMQYSLATIR